MVTGQQCNTEEFQFSSVHVRNPFWGPASPLELQMYGFPTNKYRLRPVKERDLMTDYASDFDLVTDIYDARLSNFKVFVKVQQNCLSFEVLAPLLIVNVFLSILNFQDALEYDVLSGVLFVQVFAYKKMRLEGVPNRKFDFMDVANLSTLIACILQSCITKVATTILISMNVALILCALIAQTI